MNKAIKYSIFGVGGIITIIILGIIYIISFLPNIPVEDIKVEVTDSRVERGKYLANHVTVCMDCHSKRDWGKFSLPIVPGTEGGGGEKFDRNMGFPGVYYSPNITPYNLKNWSDGEIFRAITSGVKKNGDPIFPVMPYHSYGKLDREDIYSIIAYIRTLPSKQNEPPKSESDFPMNIISHIIPKSPALTKKPDPSNKIEYGKYLVTSAACADCHTPFDGGKPVLEMRLAGGRKFEMPFGTLSTPNLTPDRKTGLGDWSEEMFVKRFKAYDPDSGYVAPKASLKVYNSIMPWIMYAGMTEEDLKAMYAYLHSLKPISNNVVRLQMKK